MNPRRILVTGAAGFVGKHLVPRLRTAFPAAELATPDAATLDITNADAVRALVAQLRPEACVHLAAVAAPTEARRDPGLAWRVNLLGTLSVAEAIRAEAPECLLVFASSADIYGRSFAGGSPLDERALPAPMNAYAATKAAADLALGAMAAEGLRVVRLRPFNHTGPGQSAAFVVPAFARQVARIAAGKQPPVLDVGALDPMRDFLDVRDVCAAYVAAVAQGEAGTTFNIASGTPRRIGDVLTSLLTLAGVLAETTTDGARLRPADIVVACGDASAARAALGWAPTIPWEDTLRDVLADWTERVAAEAA